MNRRILAWVCFFSLLFSLLLFIGLTKPAQADDDTIRTGGKEDTINTGGGDGSTGGRGGSGTKTTFTISLVNPLEAGTVPEILKSLVNWLIVLGAPVVTAMVLWGAYQILLSRGNPQEFKNGRNTILYALLGYAIVLIGWGWTSIIEGFLK